MEEFKKRARELRIQAFALDIQIKKIANDLDYAPPYVSNVLRGHTESKRALDRIEEYLDDQVEDEDYEPIHTGRFSMAA